MRNSRRPQELVIDENEGSPSTQGFRNDGRNDTYVSERYESPTTSLHTAQRNRTESLFTSPTGRMLDRHEFGSEGDLSVQLKLSTAIDTGSCCSYTAEELEERQAFSTTQRFNF